MLTLDFINVGYGDAILIRDTDAAFSMLVDCGDITVGDGSPESRRISAAEFLRREGVHALDLLVLTHLHRDHSGGLTELLRAVRVKEFWCNYLPPHEYWDTQVAVEKTFSAGSRCLLESLNIYLSALKAMEAQNATIRLMEDSPMAVDLTTDLHTEIYLEDRALFRRQEEIWQNVLEGNPSDAELDELDHFINNTSIRMRLNCGDTSVELPGDVYAACWEKHDLSPCTIMKLPHHGHKDSITSRLLDMLAPQHAVISVSNTRTDDCPSSAAIQALRARNCALYMTDAVKKDGICVPNHPSVHFILKD
ncbi:MAG: MBL fold metallo-hydrolase [Oscillibacter sp.]|nr:MBL fold metallo-hydrolase [Oscillibacter sp.]